MMHDPMSIPMCFLRIGWMNRYQGQTASDPIMTITTPPAMTAEERQASIKRARTMAGDIGKSADRPEGSVLNSPVAGVLPTISGPPESLARRGAQVAWAYASES
jgi:hypothetical protein